MTEELHSKEHIEQANQILSCAYLVAVGDAQLASEECAELENIRPLINRLLEMREAVEHYEATGDLEEALEMFPADSIDIFVFGEGNGLALPKGLPPFLSDLHEERSSLKEVDEIITLEKFEASKINDSYLQKIALLICQQVCGADGEISDGEVISMFNMCEKWGLKIEGARNWLNDILDPVLFGNVDAEGDETENYKYDV